MFIGSSSGTVLVFLLTAAADIFFIGTSAAAETRFLSFLQQQSSSLPGASNDDLFSQQQFPFQLLSSPQFGNLLALFYNISKPQSSNQPQSGDTTPENSRVLHASNPSSLNSIYTTLPFNDLNLTDFSWLWENVFVNGSSINLNSSNQEALRPQPKLFGGGNSSSTFGDVNFLTVPQLLNLFGR